MNGPEHSGPVNLTDLRHEMLTAMYSDPISADCSPQSMHHQYQLGWEWREVGPSVLGNKTDSLLPACAGNESQQRIQCMFREHLTMSKSWFKGDRCEAKVIVQ